MVAWMKIASFNINNVNRRLTNLLDWLREAEPDIASSGTQSRGRGISGGGDPTGGLSRVMARRKALERRGYSRAMAPVLTRGQHGALHGRAGDG
jgi:hypothetical protein